MGTGTKGLDAALGGGLPEAANILVVGPADADKLGLAARFLLAGLEAGKTCVCVTTDRSADDVVATAKGSAVDLWPYAARAALKFVDAYSWLLTKEAPRKPAVIGTHGPAALNELSLGIAEAMADIKPGSRAAFVSLSTLLLYNRPEMVYRFVQVIGARLKMSGLTTLFLLTPEMHEPQVIRTLEHLTDGTIEVRSSAERTEMRVPRMAGGQTFTEWKQV